MRGLMDSPGNFFIALVMAGLLAGSLVFAGAYLNEEAKWRRTMEKARLDRDCPTQTERP